MSINAGAYLAALGGGSAGTGVTALGLGASAVGSYMQGEAAMTLARSDAESARHVARKHADNIRRATKRQVGSAQAATAASGAAIDQFSAINTDEIIRAGAIDEANAVVDGEYSALASITRGKSERSAARQQAFGTVLKGASMYSGWKSPRGMDGNDPETLSYFYGG